LNPLQDVSFCFAEIIHNTPEEDFLRELYIITQNRTRVNLGIYIPILVLSTY